jgi:hypothetical protein
MGEKRGAYRMLVGKPGGQRPLGRPRSRYYDIEIDIDEVGWEWTGVVWLRTRQSGGPL